MKATFKETLPVSNRNGKAPRTGKGRSIAQHGELFQGQIEDAENVHRRCLVSLPCRSMYSEVTYRPKYSCEYRVTPVHKQKTRHVVELAAAFLNLPYSGGDIVVESTVPEAKGCGSSTADCVAAVHAVADAAGCTLDECEVARIVVRAEMASDNFMFERAVLFAHREGTVLEDYAKAFPKFEVVGVDTASGDYVHTLDHPPAVYSWRQRQIFHTLTSALRRGILQNDLELLGRVATASANINQSFLPKPKFEEIRSIAENCRALGVAVAHSGTVMSILLDPEDPRLEAKVDWVRTCLDEIGLSDTLRFQT
ncbi:MAG: hypothetical protein ACJ71W_14790 [Terriglobales bacterium]